MVFKQKYWASPPPDIIPAEQRRGSEQALQDITPLLYDFGVACSLASITQSAAVLQYHFSLLTLRKFNTAMKVGPALSAALRKPIIVSASPSAHFCVSVPKDKREIVQWSRLVHTREFAKQPDTGFWAVFGEDINNNPLLINIPKLPHLLIAGTTGSGKSVLLHSIICSLLYRWTHKSVQLAMVDTKRIELGQYDGIPHLITPVAKEVEKAISLLDDLCLLMDKRYKDIERGKPPGPPIVVIIDELADLMLISKKAVETSIVRLAQLGRAAGIHLIVATQRPTVNVVTGLIKANLPARVALTMASFRDANVIEIPGAQNLTGMGDAIFRSANQASEKLVRFQSAFCDQENISALTSYWRDKKRCQIRR